MKKRITILLATLLSALVLCGCGQGDSLRLFTGSASVTGQYEGAQEDGLPHGQGVFEAEAGWRYSGSFSQGAFGQGEAEALPVELGSGAAAFSGLYTGAVTALVPEGEGSVKNESGASFTGRFSQGLPDDGEAISLPYTMRLGEEYLTGAYTGALKGGLATGEGEFVLNDGGRCLRYQGGWAEGVPSGEGTLYDDAFTVQTPSGTDRGVFEGSTQNGLPQGDGEFRARNHENVDYCYTGEWKNGLWDGQGELVYDSELYYKRLGTFTAGAFTPSAAELLTALGTVEPYFTVSGDKVAYLENYPELLDSGESVPDSITADYRFLWQGLTYDAYFSTPGRFEKDSWILLYNYTILQQWQDASLGEEYTLTHLIASNTVGAKPVHCLIFGEVTNLSKATGFNAYVVPLAKSSYTNANGEAVDCLVVLLGSINVF